MTAFALFNTYTTIGMKRFTPLWAVFFSILIQPAWAVLDLELTRGVDRAIAIYLSPFSGQAQAAPFENITEIIRHDLAYSGRFKPVTNQADYAVSGQVEQHGSAVKIQFFLKTAAGQPTVLLHETFTIQSPEIRRLAHHISDKIYEHLTGDKGIFSTRIAYISVNRGQQPHSYRLDIADADGHNPRSLLVSQQPIMSPAWSSDGKKLSYVSFENGQSEIYTVDLASGRRQKITAFPGINSAPAWSPDGQTLAVVLSKEGNPQIYAYSLRTGLLKPLTQGRAIHTEPSFSPDGRFVIFTSDRSGSPQLYKVDVASGQITRLTFKGPYNAKGSMAPQGHTALLMLHRSDKQLTVALQDLRTGSVRIISTEGRNTSPSFAPNGKMILYATHDKGRRVLAMVSTDGKVALKLPSGQGDVQGPAWSPFLR